MLLKLNSANEIIEYCEIGTLGEGSIEFLGDLPTDFYDTFLPKKYLLQDESVIANSSYTAPTNDLPTLPPTAEQQALTAMAQQAAEHQQHISSLEKALTALAQGGKN
ncbi:DUF2977 domain-containing protein [Lactiplantibacillus mudanjiangensis]|uniref:Prophage P1 protein 56 [Lactobacillus plantarum] n=1 Tax=Lactiplantibacillus mudanjiangensis TaxID=1296538 RepID=A0A660E0C0_9LACO|nr:DUF2977 domain-containing protein [Lactiplantibacillus mudanjiangensis]VDG26336.1 prophage P1 protein 56 [Lactobacillus plantarum] [Lactiplantibacillus mudanjiangensis]VDG27860.1 prophage P1 protein 56 [Lactobacillus plantarum] [Lactiplantibacillus mudanjiangensis]